MKKLSHCKICNKTLTGKQIKFCSNICKCKDSNHRIQNYQSQQKRGIERKLAFIKDKGGQCEICGYKKNMAALCFHHINPKEKRISLDLRSFSNNNIKILSEEVNKCQLLCANCHAETHYPESVIE